MRAKAAASASTTSGGWRSVKGTPISSPGSYPSMRVTTLLTKVKRPAGSTAQIRSVLASTRLR
jgi:hypothetical protein